MEWLNWLRLINPRYPHYAFQSVCYSFLVHSEPKFSVLGGL